MSTKMHFKSGKCNVIIPCSFLSVCLFVYLEENKCYGLNVYGHCSNLCVEVSNPQCDCIWKWSIWEVIRSGGWSPYKSISALIRAGQRASLSSFCHVRIQWEICLFQPRGRPSSKSSFAGTLISDFQLPELWETNVMFLSHPVCVTLL